MGSDLLVLEPSCNAEPQLHMQHFARCFTLWLSVEGRWGGMLEKEVGCLPRLYIVLKNDKLKLEKSLGETSRRLIRKLLPQVNLNFILMYKFLKIKIGYKCINKHQ